MLLLCIIAKQDCYGYEITKQIKTYSHELIDIKEGTMYPILYKLQDENYISNYEKVIDRKVRVYYHIEEKGKEKLSEMIGTYHYTSDYGTGRLMIEATEDGIDISDYESEDTYRFLANETNVKNEEENKVYLEYPAQVYEDDTVIFEYYILEKASDGIDVYYSPSSFDEAELLYHAVREN